jgi:hypothetical protein
MIAETSSMATTTTPRQTILGRDRAGARPLVAAYWVSGSLAVVAATAAAATFFVPGVLRGPAVMNGSARGTALVMLLVGIPLLVVSMYVAAHGSMRARVVWLGAVAYFIYNAVMFVLATPFNQLYLVYEAMLALSIWSAILVIHGIDLDSFAQRFSPALPARAIATYVLVIVGLNSLVWLAGAVPAVLSTSSPAVLVGTGLVTVPTYDQDLAFWLPLTAMAAVWLWRRQAWGYLIVGAMLTYLVVEGAGVAVDQWMGSAADPSSTVASAALSPVFAALALIGLVPLFFYLRNLDGEGAA